MPMTRALDVSSGSPLKGHRRALPVGVVGACARHSAVVASDGLPFARRFPETAHVTSVCLAVLAGKPLDVFQMCVALGSTMRLSEKTPKFRSSPKRLSCGPKLVSVRPPGARRATRGKQLGISDPTLHVFGESGGDFRNNGKSEYSRAWSESFTIRAERYPFWVVLGFLCFSRKSYGAAGRLL